jgi:hypothetical protein
MNGMRARAPAIIARSDFEFECVREFSHSGVQLGASVSREERRERIRISIMRENKQHSRWRDTQLTYATAYQQAYGKPIESRRAGEEEIAPMRARPAGLWNNDAFGDDEKLDDDEKVDDLELDDTP